MNEFVKRCLTGVVFMLILVAGTLLHPILFFVVFLSGLIFTQLEFYQLVQQKGMKPQKLPGIILGVVLFISFFIEAFGLISFHINTLLFPLIVLIFFADIFRTNNQQFFASFITLAGFIYVAIPFSLLNYLVVSGDTNPVFSPFNLMGVFLIIWMYDSMAFVFGSLLGKHKIAQKISPKKSWEGLIGGAIFALIMGILNAVIFQTQSMLSWVVCALIVVIFGTSGDFFESKLKRELGVKDSGTILPGHGGLLDRFDTVLFAIPVIYFWLTFGSNLS